MASLYHTVFFLVVFDQQKVKWWLQNYAQQYRSSHRRCSVKKAVLKNFAIFTGLLYYTQYSQYSQYSHATPVLASLFNKVKGLAIWLPRADIYHIILFFNFILFLFYFIYFISFYCNCFHFLSYFFFRPFFLSFHFTSFFKMKPNKYNVAESWHSV